MNETTLNYDSINPRDVIGYTVFNCDSGMGAGEVVAMTRIEEEAHFVCDVGGRTVNRPVEQVMTQLREHGYDLCTEAWDPIEELPSSGDVEAEIADRAHESWARLADEFGLTEDVVRSIITGSA